jgi:hypothetical protein
MTTQTDSPSFGSADSSHSITDDAQAKAQEAAGRVQDQAQAAAGQAQERLRDQVEQRSTQVGEQIHEQASDLRSVSDALRDQGQDRPAQLADRIAGYAEQAGTYLKEADADTILSDAEQFGRQRPGAVAVGALAAGFAASRFLKASSSRRYAGGGRPSTSAPTGGPAYTTPVPAPEPPLGTATRPMEGTEISNGTYAPEV